MAGTVITPKALAAKWQALPNKFDVNVFNFETLIGAAAVDVFKESFTLRKFNSTGQAPWPSRNDNQPHPLLYETGSLKDSIKVKKRTPKHKVVIYTDDSEFINSNRNQSDPHKYGARKNKNRDYAFVYAAIHNMGGKGSGATGRAAFIKQRQFMGDSTVLESKLDYYSRKIFDGFPK